MILECGYTVDEDEPYCWQYIVDADAQMFHVETPQGRASWPWSDLPDDNALGALDQNDEEDEGGEDELDLGSLPGWLSDLMIERDDEDPDG